MGQRLLDVSEHTISRFLLATLVLTLGACSTESTPTHDAAPRAPDAGPIIDNGADAGAADARADAAPDAPDAGPVATGAPRGLELTSGAGRVRGGRFVLDVSLGHPRDQRSVHGPTRDLTSGAVITHPEETP